MKLNKEYIFNLLTLIPKGKVVTYKELAIKCGNEGLVRAIGNLLHTNVEKFKYPCYKVVSSKGKLSSNYKFGGITEQARLLRLEGIEVINNKVDLKKYLFRFNKED